MDALIPYCDKVFPLWMLAHLVLSLILLKKAMQTYKSKTFLPKLLHIGFFVVAFVASTVSMISSIHGNFYPYWTFIAGVGFAGNAVIGLLFLPFVQRQWVVWKRLFFIGSTFCILCGCIVHLLMYPFSPYAELSLQLCRLSMCGMCFGIFSELTLFCVSFFSTSTIAKLLPSVEEKWTFPFNGLHMFLCPGELPWKDFGNSIFLVRFALVVTIYYAYQWIQTDLSSIRAMSEQVRTTAAMIMITSAWANAISVFAPTMLYRGLMSRTPSVLLYVLFAFPIPQLSSLFIILHPTYMEGSFQERVNELLYAASFGYLPSPGM